MATPVAISVAEACFSCPPGHVWPFSLEQATEHPNHKGSLAIEEVHRSPASATGNPSLVGLPPSFGPRPRTQTLERDRSPLLGLLGLLLGGLDGGLRGRSVGRGSGGATFEGRKGNAKQGESQRSPYDRRVNLG
jgi:hypothetical protein